MADLTKEQIAKIEKFKKADSEIETLVAKKLKLDVGEFAFLRYVGKEDIKKSETVENDFTSHIFYDEIYEEYVATAGAALDKVKWEENRYYKLTFNGEMEAGVGGVNRFNAWIVESLPKDFKL